MNAIPCPLCAGELDEHMIQFDPRLRLFCSCCLVEFVVIYVGTTLTFQMITPLPLAFLFEEDGT